MMLKELEDLLSSLAPYWVFLVVPVLLLVSPGGVGAGVADAAHEFPVHRMTHLDLWGSPVGAKAAAVSMEARARSASHVLRKVVVARLSEVSVAKYNELQSAGCGALLLLVPQNADSSRLTEAEREKVLVLEEHLTTPGEIELPVYYAYETPELLDLLATLETDSGEEGKKKTATQTLLDNIISNGYQLVNSASIPKPQAEQGILSLLASLSGAGDADTLPTILVVAHTDAASAAPGMAIGADSNGSGVSILMEIARLWSKMYRSAKSQPRYNLAFLLSGGGKVNYYGTKRFLDDLKEGSSAGSTDVLHSDNLQFVICLDSVGLESKINFHVSKPPKPEMPAGRFFSDFKALAAKLYPDVSVDMVHKKINLANELLRWEHERFSLSKHSAFTLSHFESAAEPERNSLLDRKADSEVMGRNARLIAEAMACTMYNLDADNCVGNIFLDASEDLANSTSAWLDMLTMHPRGSALLATTIPKNPGKPMGKKAQQKLHPVLRGLTDALRTFTGEEVRQLVAPVDREPDYKFYDHQSEITMNAYRVKPAVFDLVLSFCIAAYLGVVYLCLQRAHTFVAILASIMPAHSLTASPKSSPIHKVNGHKANGHHNGLNGKIKAH